MIEIQLGKHKSSKNKGVAFVDEEDKDLEILAWQLHARGYATRNSGKIFMHRVILERKLGRPLKKSEKVDHANMDKLDNRRKNLRLATTSQNGANRATWNKLGIKGVKQNYKNGRYIAQITVGGKTKYLGSFATSEEASEAYFNAANQAFEDYARKD